MNVNILCFKGLKLFFLVWNRLKPFCLYLSKALRGDSRIIEKCQILFVWTDIKLSSMQIHVNISQHFLRILFLVIIMKHACTLLHLIFEELPNIIRDWIRFYKINPPTTIPPTTYQPTSDHLLTDPPQKNSKVFTLQNINTAGKM